MGSLTACYWRHSACCNSVIEKAGKLSKGHLGFDLDIRLDLWSIKAFLILLLISLRVGCIWVHDCGEDMKRKRRLVLMAEHLRIWDEINGNHAATYIFVCF